MAFKIKNRHHSTFRLRSLQEVTISHFKIFHLHLYKIGEVLYYPSNYTGIKISLITLETFTKYLPSVILIINVRIDLS